jgi:hypothetical protein
MLMFFFAGFFLISPCVWFRVLVLCSSHFMDNSNIILGSWQRIQANWIKLQAFGEVCLQRVQKYRKNLQNHEPLSHTGKETFTHILQSHQDPSFIQVKEIRCRVEPLSASILKIRELRSPPSDFWNVPHPWAVPDQREGYYTYFLRVRGMVHL